ncbi:hypothetical protein OS493_033108 [Desmophyllum pertusum]|uniref:NB-ARC domain-containing protein n=1 Tax=Desmophyllum pertusum TaxID=174260 RepID=A0A9W9YYE5_9CNID|nr:hypothetical protein OS493_033108 [Desmophyllum pertusum]
MAAVVIESTPGLQELFRDMSPKFNPTETENVVQSVKRNYGGKFNSLDNQDLLSCLQLLEKHGHVSDNKLTLIEQFVVPKISNKELQESIKETIERFKASREAQVGPEKELQGRHDDIKKITKKLETGQTLVLNLFGSAGVGKTTLANEVCSKWRGKHFVFDLREAKDMRAIYLNIMNSLELTVPIGSVDQNYVVTRIHEKIQPWKSEGQSVLFLLDNVEQFTAGKGKEGKNLKTAFVQFLGRLSEFDGKGKKTALKLLLTSRTQLQDAKKVDNFEVKSLESSFSEKILLSKGITNVNTHQKDKLIGISKGIPLLLKGLAAILRQERKSADDLITGVHKGQAVAPKKSKSEEDAKEKTFNFQEEGVDIGQLSAIREMFDTLPTDRLKMSAVSISLFCGPFSVSTAAKVLGISQSEALAQLEGLVTSAIIFVVNEEAKERMYDIHPLLRKYADSIKDDAKFLRDYMEAKGRFHEYFMSKMEKIAKLVEPDYVRAFRLFETDRANYEFTVDISLQPEYFSVPVEFHERALIASLFNAMLSEDKQIKLFHLWAKMCEDDGKSGSLCRAQLKCWEARQILDVEGTEKAFEVLMEASCSLEKVQDKCSESYRLSKGLLLYSEGEAYCKNRDYKKSLKSLESSLKCTEELLSDHTDLARCYNAIGNCHFSLNRPMKALEFYNKACKMQESLAGEYHYDMPMYKNQIGTVHENQGEYDKAVECYKEALRLLDELKLSGFWDEAHFCRNLANALMFQKQYSEAVAPADRAYNIRVKILGNHPLTVRSIFQRAVIQANFRDFKKALQLFLEAWEMEKSLGAGNHSEVWRKVIKGVEDMHDFLNSGRKKGQFRKDALKFCQRFWDEEKNSAQFSFTQFNKDIIDAIMYLIGDKKDRYETEKEALWFYEGMQSATEGEFQDEFDQETDNSALNEMLKERDENLDKLIDLCLQLDEHEKLRKYKNDKLALYKGILVRVDFVGEKKYDYDKETLKSKVEQLYQDVGQTKDIPKFRENLLSTWQTQWEEGKGGEKMKEIGVGRERTINGILQLCMELKQLAMFRRYGKEALSFYEDVWEVKQATMKPPEMKKFLRKIKQLASSIGDHKSEILYDEALQTLIKTGKQPGAMFRPNAKQAASKTEEEEEEEEEEEIVIGSEEDIDVGSVEGSEKEIKMASEDEEIVVGSEEENEVGAEDSETETNAPSSSKFRS